MRAFVTRTIADRSEPSALSSTVPSLDSGDRMQAALLEHGRQEGGRAARHLQESRTGLLDSTLISPGRWTEAGRRPESPSGIAEPHDDRRRPRAGPPDPGASSADSTRQELERAPSQTEAPVNASEQSRSLRASSPSPACRFLGSSRLSRLHCSPSVFPASAAVASQWSGSAPLLRRGQEQPGEPGAHEEAGQGVVTGCLGDDRAGVEDRAGGTGALGSADELSGEQDVGGFRGAVGDRGVVPPSLPVEIVRVDAPGTVGHGAGHDDARPASAWRSKSGAVSGNGAGG